MNSSGSAQRGQFEAGDEGVEEADDDGQDGGG